MLIYGSALEAAPGKSGQLGPQLPALRDTLAKSTGQPWWAWAVAVGRPFGSFLLSTRVNDMVELLEAQQKVGASTEFQKLSAGLGGLMAAPAETTLTEIIGMTGEPGEPKPLITITRAAMVGGHIGEALAWSTKVMEYITDLTGVGGVVGASTAGPMFQVSWLVGSDEASQIDDTNAKLNADAGYLEMIDAAGGLFIPGSAERVVIAMMP